MDLLQFSKFLKLDEKIIKTSLITQAIDSAEIKKLNLLCCHLTIIGGGHEFKNIFFRGIRFHYKFQYDWLVSHFDIDMSLYVNRELLL